MAARPEARRRRSASRVARDAASWSDGADRQLVNGLQAMNMTASDHQREQISAYAEQLLHWNRRINLTSIVEPERVVTHHLLDSMTLLPWLTSSHRLVDIGSGGGLPGLMVAIMRPTLPVFLIEPRQKRGQFLLHAARHLQLDNVEVVISRAEDYRAQEKFDTLACRALASLEQFYHWSEHLAVPGARWLAMKGERNGEEEVAIGAAGLSVRAEAVRVPGLDAARHIVIFEQPTHQEPPAGGSGAAEHMNT
ncbi:16S rRNA (guanine(527)-N(7))-methyltransferase RsmG [Gammaproteobacteria bacterium]|nr:16S rRNA (guanine(527)-N(7))-methyltransferase RsmG [Gammaproteobacteria bacterium]